MATVAKSIKLTNGVSYGAYIADATKDDVYTLTFEGVTGNAVDYPLAVLTDNGTVTNNGDGTYSLTVSADGPINIIAQRARTL